MAGRLKYLALVMLLLPQISFAQVNDGHVFPSTDLPAQKPLQALLYVMGTKKSIQSLRKNVAASDIVAPQTYTIDKNGNLFGKPKQEILDIAEGVGAQVMPLVSNSKFNQSLIDSFLKNPVAQDKLLNRLVLEAKSKKYIGYQYDFEHIPSFDRDLYSAFVQKSAPIFHQNGLELSVAVSPMHSDNPNDYGLGSWQNWTGAFDYSVIGQSADFVSIMAYDDSNSKGPTASLPWVTQVLNYSLAHIPAQKISLGIPFYAWVRSAATGRRQAVVTYPALAQIINGEYLDKGWSEDLSVPWVKYSSRRGTLIAWYEDSRSFDKKIELIQQNKILGFSAWALGEEDPKVWDSVIALRAGVKQVALR